MFCVTLPFLLELSYTFEHICTNLLTQCTQLPVPIFCYFCISGFPAIKSAQKIPEKLYKKSSSRKPPESPRKEGRATTGTPKGSLARPHPRPRRAPSWLPCGPPGAPLWSYFYPRGGNPDSRPLFSRSNSDLRRHRHQVLGGKNSCAGTLPGRGSAPRFISIDVASLLHEAGVVPPQG